MAGLNKLPELEWLIIGGGIHGTHMAICLKAAGIQKFKIIDPHAQLLAHWKQRTGNVGMQYLRSPRVHHVGKQPFALQQFINEKNKANLPYRPPNGRPSLALFNAYAAAQIKAYNLGEHHVQHIACGIEHSGGALQVHTTTNTFRSRNVILACGRCGQLLWPGWAVHIQAQGGNIRHVFDEPKATTTANQEGQQVVVGAGQSGAQLALALCERNPGNITLLSRSQLKKSDYDTPPGWMGPKYLHAFYREKQYGRRRRMITQARSSGTMTPDIYRRLMHAINQKKITHIKAEVTQAELFTPQLMMLRLQKGISIGTNSIHLATGFTAERPGGSLVNTLIQDFDLRCASCGYPIAGASLEWGAGIYVTGALAELELGPAAQNIIGARHAAPRILHSIR